MPLESFVWTLRAFLLNMYYSLNKIIIEIKHKQKPKIPPIVINSLDKLRSINIGAKKTKRAISGSFLFKFVMLCFLPKK